MLSSCLFYLVPVHDMKVKLVHVDALISQATEHRNKVARRLTRTLPLSLSGIRRPLLRNVVCLQGGVRRLKTEQVVLDFGNRVSKPTWPPEAFVPLQKIAMHALCGLAARDGHVRMDPPTE